MLNACRAGHGTGFDGIEHSSLPRDASPWRAFHSCSPLSQPAYINVIRECTECDFSIMSIHLDHRYTGQPAVLISGYSSVSVAAGETPALLVSLVYRPSMTHQSCLHLKKIFPISLGDLAHVLRHLVGAVYKCLFHNCLIYFVCVKLKCSIIASMICGAYMAFMPIFTASAAAACRAFS